LVSLDDSPVVPGNALDANDSIAKNLTDVPAFSFNEDSALTEEINLNEQEFALAASPLDLADEEACASATIDQAGIDSELDLEDTDPALDFDPTRPVHEWVETNIMVQSDLFAAQDLTSLATVKSHAPHSLVETSDDILFGDAGIEDLVFDDENLALQNQDESLSTRLAKVTSMTFGKNLLHRKRVAAKKATDLVLKHEREKQAEVVEQVISIFVTANHSQGFYGPQLLQLLQECGLVHGDMNIFHRFEDGLRLGKTQFSMANMMEPGTFDLAQMDQLHTPGVVFFLTLPTAQNNMQAFDYMLETAQCLASNLGGDILDEQRSVMRPQTIEHCRQQIREFERRHMTRRAQL
jgi:cell division protein ZipA